jgi:hypothetical protein
MLASDVAQGLCYAVHYTWLVMLQVSHTQQRMYRSPRVHHASSCLSFHASVLLQSLCFQAHLCICLIVI